MDINTPNQLPINYLISSNIQGMIGSWFLATNEQMWVIGNKTQFAIIYIERFWTFPQEKKTKQCHLEGKKSRHCREAMAIAAVPVPMKHQSSLVGGFLTILKNISQWEGLSHILWKIKNVWNHQADQISIIKSLSKANTMIPSGCLQTIH